MSYADVSFLKASIGENLLSRVIPVSSVDAEDLINTHLMSASMDIDSYFKRAGIPVPVDTEALVESESISSDVKDFIDSKLKLCCVSLALESIFFGADIVPKSVVARAELSRKWLDDVASGKVLTYISALNSCVLLAGTEASSMPTNDFFSNVRRNIGRA